MYDNIYSDAKCNSYTRFTTATAVGYAITIRKCHTRESQLCE